MRKNRYWKRIVSLCMSTVLLIGGMSQGMPIASAATETYTFTSSDVRIVLSSLFDGGIPDTPLGEQADRNEDGVIDSTDARVMLQELMSGNNTVTLAENVIRLSSISDLTDSSGSRSYDVKVPYTDTYTLSCSNATSITLSHGTTTVASGTTSLSVSLQEGAIYTLTITTRRADTAFSLTTTPQNHPITLPYDVAQPIDTSEFVLDSDADYDISASALNYQKRGGGTYVYCNNPEILGSDSIGDALIQTEGLTDEVYVTFEHSNASGSSFYLGYQLKNEGNSDVYVTVTNVGYQTSGSWYGQKAWYDFYNTSFALPSDYYTSSSYDRDDFLFEQYTPRVFQPITYRLPAGKAFYVVGGTTSDAYRNINVGSTANQRVSSGKCANAAVKFIVTGGSVRGTLYAYSNTSQVSADPAPVGYRVDNNMYGNSYGVQYKGTGDHAGVIDSYLTWTFNDNIGAGLLPVTYTTEYASNPRANTTPYAAYANQSHQYTRATEWATHINPQENHMAVGTDMVTFACTDTSGTARLIDTAHADGTGDPANIGNWMIEYQEHFTLVNQGAKDRVIRLMYMDNGALAMLARDSKTGEVLSADFPVGKTITGYNYTYEVTVPAHSVQQITMDYLLMPMSYGNINHMVAID